MSTKISRAKSGGTSPVRIFIAQAKDLFPEAKLSKTELAYAKKWIKEDRDLITVNRFDSVIYLVPLKEKAYNSQTAETLRGIGNKLTSSLNALKWSSANIEPAKGFETHGLALAEGMALGNYQFLRYKSKPEANALKEIKLISNGISSEDIEFLQVSVDAVCKARDLVNEPQSFLNAIELGNQFKKMAKEAGFSIDVFNETKIRSLKMGGLIAVNMGSQTPPTFSVMEYKPKGAKNKKPFIVVGKGVVYDTGGLSLKPTPNSMDSMKCDMAGAAVAAGFIYAAARLKWPYHVMAFVPATDNRPGENAYAPGDVIEMMSGLKIEMLNADAEGRMILGDALHYAKRYQPGLVFDFATLTGAAVAAVGTVGMVGMGTAGDSTKKLIKESAEQVHERVVEFPLWDEYKTLLKSDIADMKNIGGPLAGAITAGKFLEAFTDYPWYHFDIAGPAFLAAADSYRGKNGTGYGIRFLLQFVKNGGIDGLK